MKKGYIIDLDGTVYSGALPIDGADIFVNYLNKSLTPYVFLTNCPSRTRSEISKYVEKMGIFVAEEKIVTSGMLAAMYLKDIGYKRLFVLGGDALKQEISNCEMAVCDGNPDAVLIGWDKELTYNKLQKAFSLILDGKPFYSTNPDVIIPGTTCPQLHTGSFTALLEKASGKKAFVLGKPSMLIWKYVLETLGQECSPCVVGDTLEYDVQFAANNNAEAVLTLTGLTTREMIGRLESRVRVVDNLSQLIPDSFV